MTVSRAQFAALYEQYLPAVSAYLRRRVARDAGRHLGGPAPRLFW